MYVSGNRLTFATRLHQLGGDSAALTTFRIEAKSYLPTVSRQLSGQWEKEARMQQYRFSGRLGLTTQQFTTGTAGLPDVPNPEMPDMSYVGGSLETFEINWSTTNVALYSGLELWVNGDDNSATSTLAYDLTSQKFIGFTSVNAIDFPAMIPNGPVFFYYYFLKARGSGIGYSTNRVASTPGFPMDL